ncbi:MAG: hypothetical protein IPK17_33055 [Chloroflexi bacterium]|uniref:SH3 domain-containing protein n=1 Tax=Candidatus Flexifilum breve TaxID=3140694 RepID=UPI003135CEBC|nr:hypothetical protein [Chloroflexota bacterium]
MRIAKTSVTLAVMTWAQTRAVISVGTLVAIPAVISVVMVEVKGNMRLFRKVGLMLVVLCFATVAAQGDTCSDLVTQALTAVQAVCAETGRNQACYGNISIDATPREAVTDFTFEQQGDLVNVAAVQSLRLRALDVAENEWGIALMKLQADLPDTLPGQNVTFLMFGDVEIENAVDPSATVPTVDVTTASNVNIRTLPSTNGGIAGSLASGEVTTANGRNEASDWLRIRIPESDSFGWVYAPLLTVTGDVAALNVVDSLDAEIPFTPMQAFYFRTGVAADVGCTEAPPNGLLIQTPEGVGEINLRANDVDITLGSTAYLEAIPGDELSISVIEGQGEITAQGETVIVPAGASVGVPLDEDMRAAGAPEDLRPYDPAAFSNLPIQVLPRTIEVAPPLDEDALLDAQNPGGAGGFAGDMEIDLDALAGLDMAMFCPIMNQMLADIGMSRDEYVGLLRQALVFSGGEDQADVEGFIALLQSCPVGGELPAPGDFGAGGDSGDGGDSGGEGG